MQFFVLPSLNERVHSHILVLLTKIKDRHCGQRIIELSFLISSEGQSIISKHLKTLVKKTDNHKKKHTYRDCIAVKGQQVTFYRHLVYKKLYMKDDGLLRSRLSLWLTISL